MIIIAIAMINISSVVIILRNPNMLIAMNITMGVLLTKTRIINMFIDKLVLVSFFRSVDN